MDHRRVSHVAAARRQTPDVLKLHGPVRQGARTSLETVGHGCARSLHSWLGTRMPGHRASRGG